MSREKKQAVQGKHLPSPHLTRAGLFMLLKYVALPILTVLVLIDVALYFYFKLALGKCYGVLCLF